MLTHQGETKEPKDLWMEPYTRASSWIPCSHTRNWEPSGLTSLSLSIYVRLRVSQKARFVL